MKSVMMEVAAVLVMAVVMVVGLPILLLGPVSREPVMVAP